MVIAATGAATKGDTMNTPENRAQTRWMDTLGRIDAGAAALPVGQQMSYHAQQLRAQLLMAYTECAASKSPLPPVYGTHRVEVVFGQQVLVVDADHTEDCTTVHSVYTRDGSDLTEMFFDRALRERIEDLAAVCIDADAAEAAE